MEAAQFEGLLASVADMSEASLDELAAAVEQVLQATGICVLPDYLCTDELRDGRLALVLPGWEPPQARVLAVFPSRRGMVAAVPQLLDFVGENMAGERIVGESRASVAAAQQPAARK
jgi:DNA-binding transcriptional LysR family regulator